jgi:hypothetical protein
MSRALLRRVGLALLGLALLAVLALVLGQLQQPYRTSFNGSAHDSGTGGGQALWRWTRLMGWPVTVAGAALPAVPQLPQAQGNCLLSAGNAPLEGTSEEWRALHDWVAAGNSLFLVTTLPGSLPKELFEEVLDAPEPKPQYGVSTLLGSGSTPQRQIAAAGHPFSIDAGGPRWSGTPAQWETAGDAQGSVYHRAVVGKGAVVILLDAYALSNEGLDAPGNPEAVAALLRRELHGGSLVFDEARHGYGEAQSYLGALLAVPGARQAVLLGLLLAVLLLVQQNVRLGPPQPYRTVERRSVREYIDALAGLHERARSAPLMVEAVARRLHGLARRRGRPADELEPLLARAAAFRQAAPRDKLPRQAQELVRELIGLRRKILGSQRTQD